MGNRPCLTVSAAVTHGDDSKHQEVILAERRREGGGGLQKTPLASAGVFNKHVNYCPIEGTNPSAALPPAPPLLLSSRAGRSSAAQSLPVAPPPFVMEGGMKQQCWAICEWREVFVGEPPLTSRLRLTRSSCRATFQPQLPAPVHRARSCPGGGRRGTTGSPRRRIVRGN